MIWTQGKGRLVVGQGDEGLCGLMQTRLVLAGYDVAIARTGGRVVELLRAQTAGLLLDLDLPGRGALEVLEWMHRSNRIRWTRVLVTAAQPHPDRVRTVMELGACALLLKPFDDADLLARVSGLLDSTRPAAMARRA